MTKCTRIKNSRNHCGNHHHAITVLAITAIPNITQSLRSQSLRYLQHAMTALALTSNITQSLRSQSLRYFHHAITALAITAISNITQSLRSQSLRHIHHAMTALAITAISNITQSLRSQSLPYPPLHRPIGLKHIVSFWRALSRGGLVNKQKVQRPCPLRGEFG